MNGARLVRTVRLSTPILIVAAIVLGPIFHLVYGSLCTIGTGSITLTCPLGFLQVSLASRSVIISLLVPMSLTLVFSILLGRFFCGWICPAGELMQRLGDVGRPSKASRLRWIELERNTARLALLSSFLVATAIFRYPVFCVFCPIGIISRNAISLFQYGSVGLDLLFIPLTLILELGLAPWCSHICPLGTTLRILGSKSPLTPVIDKAKCVSCSVCTKICNMRVSPLEPSNLEDCSKCMECSLRCPTGAIRWRRHRRWATPHPKRGVRNHSDAG
jgi:ferredoxin-type protein NapH